jgi:hypothetical protein
MAKSASKGSLGPIQIRLRAHVRAPAEVIWAILVDWERNHQWMLEASRFRVTSEHREGVGVEVRAHVRIGGITTVDSVRVSRWEPPYVLGIDHLGWVKGRAVIECIPTGQGTRVEWLEELTPPLGAVGGLGIRLFKPLMTRIFTRDLAVLKRLAEEKAGTRSPGPPAPAGRRPASGEGRGAAPGGSAGPRPAEAAALPRPRSGARRPEASSLFARWFWLVYLPLGLIGAVLLLVLAGLVPSALKLPLIAVTGAWSAVALRLLIERRRRGLAVPAPRSIVVGILAVAGLAVGGGLLAWIGIGRVSSSEGLAMLLVGCFFMLMAVFAPMFKLVDSGFRLAARLVSRRSKSAEPPRTPPEESGGIPAATSSQR